MKKHPKIDEESEEDSFDNQGYEVPLNTSYIGKSISSRSNQQMRETMSLDNIEKINEQECKAFSKQLTEQDHVNDVNEYFSDSGSAVALPSGNSSAN
jgi:hypothetical protein